MEGKAFLLQPVLPTAASPLVHRFRVGLERCARQPACVEELLGGILSSSELEALPNGDKLTTRLFFEVLQDLVQQGWRFDYRETHLVATPPDAVNGTGGDQQEIKRRLRTSLVAARNEQLREGTTRQFLLDLERPRAHRGRQVSVLNLFLSSKALALDLQRRLSAPETIREELLQDSVRPYLQLATEERDEFTDLRLIDIWRYCRYTWSLPLSNQPGRQMLYLIRDGARDFHPIMGIGALGNSVVQITVRDEEIGWSVASLRSASNIAERMKALDMELARAIDEIMWVDLVSEDEVVEPTAETLERLMVIAGQGSPINRSAARMNRTALLEEARSPAFRRKRATELHRLLRAKQVFQLAASQTHGERERIEWLLAREEGRQALGAALRSIKKRHIGSSMMDITTCGAIPPYNELLAGKLVALLMASPQVIADYRSRYGEAASEIASRMKGEDLVRPADLVLLGTTSLYYVGSSQYNRLRMPVANGELRYLPIGKTRGFGSLHLSQRTYRTLQQMLRSHPELHPESYAFAAGVNYKMRSIASGLSHLGLAKLQQHETPRLVYLVPLASNWREYLTGLQAEPKYLYGQLEEPHAETSLIVKYWNSRWFLPRVQKIETMRRLRAAGGVVPVSEFVDGEQSAPPTEATSGRGGEPAGSGGGAERRMSTESKISWRALAELKDQRASFAERLSVDELQTLHVRTKLDSGLIGEIRAGRRLYLTGNPGDGKTHIIRRYCTELEGYNAFINLDASAEDEATLLRGLEEAIREGKPAVVAINEGPLRRLLPKLPPEERDELHAQLDRPYIYANDEAREHDALVINLGVRQLLSRPTLEAMLDVVLGRVDFDDAPEQVKRNRSMLGRPRVRERLLHLLGIVARSGAHVTMHELLGFFSFIITAGRSRTEEAASIPPYYNLIFNTNSPLARWLQHVDPARISHPLVDMRLWDDPGDQIEWLESPTGGAPESYESLDEGMKVFRGLKRRYYFESKHGDEILAMIPEDRRVFYELLEESGEARHTATSSILEALSLFFGEVDTDGQGNQLRIWTSLRYEATSPPTAFISSQSVSAEDMELLVPRLRPQVAALLEYEPSQLRLVVHPRGVAGSPVGLTIDLELWLALMQLKRGMPQRYHDPVIGRRLNQFMSRLATQYQERPGGYVPLQVRGVESGQTYQINVSLERGRYT